MRLVAPALVSIIVAGCDVGVDPGSTPDDAEQQDATTRTGSLVQWLPFTGGVFDLLPADFDGNGLTDLAITAHGESYTQIFYQRAPRRFEPSARITEVGFHPGDLLPLATPAGEAVYLMHAEGDNALKVFAFSDGGEFRRIAQLAAPAPRTGTPFRWPDRGLGLAVAPFGHNSILLIEDFQPRTAERGLAYRIPLTSALSRVHQLTSGDIDSDGTEEVLLVDAWRAELFAIHEPADDQAPALDRIWSVEDRARISQVQIADLDRDDSLELVIPEEVAPDQPDRRPRIHVLSMRDDGSIESRAIAYPKDLGADDHAAPRGFGSIDIAYDPAEQQHLMALTTDKDLLLYRFSADWPNVAPITVRLPFSQRSSTRRGRLIDIDGDGQLDLVLGLSHSRGNAQILYGPLWEGFAQASEVGLTLDELPQLPMKP